VIIPRAYAQPREFDRAVESAISKLGPDVVRVRYSFGNDWTGEPSVFFKVVLSDNASARLHLLDVTSRIANTLVWDVEPLEQWGVLPYFNYRSQTEQETLQEPAWA